jgi:hypothetical protein
VAHYLCRCGETIDDVRFPNPKTFHAIREDDIEQIQSDVISWVREATERGDHLRDDFDDELCAAISNAFDGPLYGAHPDLSRERLFMVCPDCGRLYLLSQGDGEWAQVTWQLEAGNPWPLIAPLPGS